MGIRKIGLSRIIISTALGHDGTGIFPYTLWPAYRRLLEVVRATGTTILAKSATRHPRRGNFIPGNPLTWHYIRRLPDQGMLNAYGLTNAGAERCAADLKVARDLGYHVIPNLYPEFAKGEELALKDTLEAAAIYRRVLGPQLTALEINFSCPNSAENIAANVAAGIKCVQEVRRQFPSLFLLAKISVCHPYAFAQELAQIGVDALHAVNTVPFEMVFPGRRSPLGRVGGGGVSGGPAFNIACGYNRDLRRKVDRFLVMGCGVRNFEDVQTYFDLGADAVSLCTMALRQPAAAAELISSYNKTDACI